MASRRKDFLREAVKVIKLWKELKQAPAAENRDDSK